MGTRSNIAVEQPNGEVVVAYCHYDGYPEYNGQLLNDHYNTTKKAKDLVNQGYFSSLKKTVAESIEDRVHKDKPFTYPNLDAYLEDVQFDIEWICIYKDNQWLVSKAPVRKESYLKPLWSVLARQEVSA